VIKKTVGNETNYCLVEMIDEKLENMEKVRKRRGGIVSKEQHPIYSAQLLKPEKGSFQQLEYIYI
jgi:hypothetical protein